MTEKDSSDLPRREALLTTISAGSALVGLSTVGAGKDAEPSNQDDGHSASNLPSKTQDVPEEWLDEEGNLSIPESDLDKFGVEVYDKETKEELDSVDTQVVNIENEGELSERYQQHQLLDHSSTLATPASDWSSPLYRTLWEGEAGGYSMKIQAGIKVRRPANWSLPEVSMDFTITIAGVSFEIYSLTVRQDEDDGFCVSPKVPPQFPIEIEVCLDIRWSGGTAIEFGVSGDVCTVDVCPWVDCTTCRGIGGSRWVDLSGYI